MDMNFISRRLTHDDLPVLLALCESNPHYYELYGGRPTLENLSETLSELPPGCDAGQKQFLGYFDADGLVAVADVVRGYPDERTAYIGLLMVDSGCHRQGIGTHICSEIFDGLHDEGFSHVRLAYIQNNEAARIFWEQLGFAPSGRPVETPSYVAIPMERAL